MRYVLCCCVLHALRAGRGAHCPSVFVRRPSLLEMSALFIYLLNLPSKILLVQVWTLSSSFFANIFSSVCGSYEHTRVPEGELLTGFAMRSDPNV